MPAYAQDGTVVCFVQRAQKFNTRYAMLGFSDTAHLDDGAMGPTAFALTEVTAADEARIGALVQKAVRCGRSAAQGRPARASPSSRTRGAGKDDGCDMSASVHSDHVRVDGGEGRCVPRAVGCADAVILCAS
jgi:hypothetical protein